MKILYSQIKELLPGLKAGPKEIAETLTLIGFMADGMVKDVRWRGKKDYLIGLEIRQNRPDCLSVIGLAKEIGAYYGLKLKIPKVTLPPIKAKKELKINVNTSDKVIKRILAIEIDGIKNNRSPKWIVDFLSFYDINSINLAVDLSNYAMLYTGYPSHLFDLSKLNDQIFWSLNKDFKKIVTLDGSETTLKGGELIVNDNEKILAIAGIIGGKTAEVSTETSSVLLEIAVYDSAIVRKDSRNLKINTEASQRLSKNLSPNGLDFAMNFLVSALIKNCQGKVASRIFSYYPKKENQKKISLDLKSPSVYSGIDIPEKESVKILNNLGFKTEIKGEKILCTVPAERTDISLEEDLVEEVIRIFGYDKIPTEQLPKFDITRDITPDDIRLAEKIRDILFSAEGLDEIFSCPLVKEGENQEVNYLDWQIASTQNSVNEEYPDLRQSLAIGLVNQLNEYIKKNVEHIKIFEIGKIFGKKGRSQYQERDVVGILKKSSVNEKGINGTKKSVENLLRLLGLVEITYRQSETKPPAANPYSCWNIFSKKHFIGIIYKLKWQNNRKNAYFAELYLDEIIKVLKKTQNKPVVELTRKLVVLDANIELKNNESIDEFLSEIKKKIGPNNIWSLAVIDEFNLEKKKMIRYTVRVSYVNLSDLEAKKIHSLKITNIYE